MPHAPAVFEIHGDLRTLLRPGWRDAHPLVQPVTRRASIKDVLESFGLPHTEIGRILCGEREVDFAFAVEEGQRFAVFPVLPPWNVTAATLLRPEPLDSLGFIVDVNVGRLARYLRMAGLDVLFDPGWDDTDIIDLLGFDRRVVLTRDLGLLKRKRVEFGRYVRSENPAEQLQEIIRLFGLEDELRPFSRCLECNTPLEPVAKEEVIHRLEPLTKKYYHSFSRCPSCDRIYWAGSHTEDMRRLFPGYF
jgi:hypothetical protein